MLVGREGASFAIRTKIFLVPVVNRRVGGGHAVSLGGSLSRRVSVRTVWKLLTYYCSLTCGKKDWTRSEGKVNAFL